MNNQLPQPTLFTDLSGDFQIKKHSSFIQMQGDASLNQRKAMNGIIYMVKDQLNRNPEQRIFAIDLGVLKKLSGVRGTDNSQFKKALRGLTTMGIEYNILNKDSEARGVFSFLSHAHIQVEQRGKASTVMIECPTIVLEAIRRPRIYSKLNLMITRGIESKHGLIMYELLTDYINLGKIRVELRELRKLFGIVQHQYKSSFDMFKRRVLEAAIKEVNKKTNIRANIDEVERVGRKVVAVTFSAVPNERYFLKEVEDTEVYQQLKSYGFSDKRAGQIVDQHDKEYILANIAVVEEQYTNKGKQIDSIPALLTTAFKTDFRNPKNEHTKLLAKQQKQDVLAKEMADQQIKEEDELQKAFTNHINKLTQERKSELSREEYDNHKQAFIDQLGEGHMAMTAFRKHGLDHKIVEASFTTYLRDKLLTAQELDFAVFKKTQSKVSDQTNEP